MKERACRIFCAGAVKVLTGARAVWHAPPPADDRPRVYFANHGSHLDFVTLWAALPSALRLRTRPVAAKDFWTASRGREWMASGVFRALLIDREAVTRANNPVSKMAEALDARDSLILFPEGTRSLTGETAAFKAGLYHLARRCPDAVLVPVHLLNLNRALPKGESLPIPVLSTVIFGPDLPRVPDEPREAFLERARDAVLRLAD